MELKNIKTRKEYIKTNEIFGGTEGGVGARDGFANNAALGDTYLGKLVNGMFKGLSWLWRKSKENFIINRLIAKLINELIRGVIIYCFVKNIDLMTGKSSDVNVDDKSEDETSFDKIKNEIDGENIGRFDNFINGDADEDIVKQAGIKTESGKPIIKTINDVKEVIDPTEYDKIKNESYQFLKKHINFFDDIKAKSNDGDDDETKKLNMIKAIYINYEIIKKLKSNISVENTKSVSESIINEGLAKLKTDSSAGKIGPTENKPTIRNKSISSSSSSSSDVTVKKILNKRDQDKYIKHEKDFKISIGDINLAEIEKTINRKEQSMKEVSSHVNPESLKVIQLTAKGLFIADNEGQNVEKTKLKLRWDKELSKVYASFSLLMYIPDVDIREDNYGSGLNLSGSTTTSKTDIKRMNNDTISLSVADGFGDALNPGETKIDELYGNWQYSILEYQGTNYNCTIAPISSAPVHGFYMFMISQTIKKLEKNVITSDLKEFKKIFVSSKLEGITINAADTVNVYFMLNKNAKLPSGTVSKSSGIGNKFLVFNNYISADGKINKLFLCEASGNNYIAEDYDMSAPDSEANIIIDKFVYSNYQKDNIVIKSCRKFDKWKLWWKALNLITDSNDIKFCGFKDDVSSPKFFSNTKVLENLKKIGAKF